MNIYSIGHSTHSEEEFIKLLDTYKINMVVDVRSFPGSRHVPIFNKETMIEWLKKENIDYIHLKKLGGLRKKDKDVDSSLIDAWRNTSFRNYAAYTLSNDYREAIEELKNLASKHKVVIMCSEAVPWRCHRLIVSNTLVHEGVSVEHIMTPNKVIKHTLGIFGAMPVEKDGLFIYPKEDLSKGEAN